MEDHCLLFKLENDPCKSEVKEEEDEHEEIVETKPDVDEKLDVLTPLILDLVGFKSEPLSSNVTKPDVDEKLDVLTPLVTLDLVAFKSEPFSSNVTKPDVDEKLSVLTPRVILDLVAFKSESVSSNVSLKEEVKLEVKEEYFSGDDTNTSDSKEIEEFYSLNSEERCMLVPIRKHEQGHVVDSKKRNVPHRKSQSTRTTKKKYIRERKFECHHCAKKFRQGDVLKSHIRIHTGERPYVCSVCKNTFRTKTLLKNHVQLHSGKRFKCDYCEKEFQQNFRLKCHLLIHTGNKPVYICDVCKKSYSSKSFLKRHIHEIHLGQLRNPVRSYHRKPTVVSRPQGSNRSKSPVTCSECNKQISCKKNLELHWKRCHETTKTYSFTCAHCDKGFTEKLGLIRHINTYHLESIPMICQYCKKTFKNDFYLKIHVKIHHQDDKSTRYVCDICQMGFRRDTYMKRHRQTHTDEDKKFSCDTCGQRCRSKTDMYYHMLTHMKNAPKPFKCDKCSMAFEKATKLKRHQLVHSNVRPYKCKRCSKSYKDSSSLKIHNNTVHFNAIFICDTCGFHSINESSFKRHLRQNQCAKILLKNE